MTWNGELEEIKREIHLETYNKGIPDVTFIPYDKIQKVWAGNRLDRFLRDPYCDPDHGTDRAISDSQIEEARDSLLRMISLLIGISWSGWPRFKQIFFLHPDAASERRDDNIENLKYDDLKHESFLGDTPFIEQFLQYRWTYIPMAVICDEERRYKRDEERNYKPETRLPLVRQDCSPRNGAFGEVTKETVSPGHIVLKNSSYHLGVRDQTNSVELTVARKRFPTKNFHAERLQLEFLQSSLSYHKRIVYPLATVMIDTDLNIIMPWADMDLEDYLLGGYQSMKFDASLLASLLKESGELAGALKFLHGGLQAKCEWPKLPQQALCHADFRPRNILVFKKDDSSTGTWGITDFGVSQQYNSSLSRDIYESGLFSTRNSVPPPRGGMYQAPDPHASQKSDIWSFGCILTQIFGLGLAHAHHFLPRALEERPLERKLTWKPFNVRFCGEGLPALNPEVEKWIEELPDLYCGSFHNLFLTEMKSLLSSMLQINSESRPSATKVRRHLHSLYRMATGDGLPFTDPGSTTPLPISTPPRSSISSDPDLRTPGPPIDRLSIGLLVVIIESGDVKSVKECLKSKPDVEEHHENDRPLIHAIKIKGESAPIVSALLQYKSDLDVETPSFAKETPLHLAISKGDVDLVRLLIGALVRNNSESGLNELSTKGKTPLMEAAYRGHVAVVSALLDAGADTKICTGDDKHNCLHYAVDNIASEEDLIRAFLGRNMDFNLSPSGITGYETPIMRHIWNGVHGKYGIPKANARWKRKFDALLDGGGNVNMPYPRRSPLEIAIKENKVDIVEELMMAGAELPRGEIKATHEMKRLIKRLTRTIASNPSR